MRHGHALILKRISSYHTHWKMQYDHNQISTWRLQHKYSQHRENQQSVASCINKRILYFISASTNSTAFEIYATRIGG